MVEELDQLKDAWGSISTLPYMSLCLVEKSGYLDNKIRLRRQSDIQDGMILDSYSSNIPSSRPYLFGKNLPPVGTIGVWRWNEDENHYVTVQRNLAFQLIQVIMLQAANETSLVEAVKMVCLRILLLMIFSWYINQMQSVMLVYIAIKAISFKMELPII